MAGNCSSFGGQRGGASGCPQTLTLGTPARVPRAQPEHLLRFPGGSITRDGTRCAGGSLLVARTLDVHNPAYMAELRLRGTVGRFIGSALARNWLAWSDPVGVIEDSWACGGSPGGTAPTPTCCLGTTGGA